MVYSDYVRSKYERKRMSKSDREDLENFCDWLDEVEEIVEEEIGYDLSTLPDQSYREWFDEDSSPEDAAEFFINDWRLNGDIPSN